jgi:hypothetical protein
MGLVTVIVLPTQRANIWMNCRMGGLKRRILINRTIFTQLGEWAVYATVKFFAIAQGRHRLASQALIFAACRKLLLQAGTLGHTALHSCLTT